MNVASAAALLQTRGNNINDNNNGVEATAIQLFYYCGFDKATFQLFLEIHSEGVSPNKTAPESYETVCELIIYDKYTNSFSVTKRQNNRRGWLVSSQGQFVKINPFSQLSSFQGCERAPTRMPHVILYAGYEGRDNELNCLSLMNLCFNQIPSHGDDEPKTIAG